MTTEEKALALVNEVCRERDRNSASEIRRDVYVTAEALCRAIEAHEAYRRKVSEAVKLAVDAGVDEWVYNVLSPFIIPEGDPLVEAMNDLEWCNAEQLAPDLRAALASRGITLTKGQPDA